jgi:large conductance mechanosensitive channel
MGFFKEFKEFAIKGNVLDLAMGIIIGAAFGTVVNSLVNDIIMPPIGKLLKNIDFKNLFLSLDSSTAGIKDLEAARKAGAVIAYGNFIQNVITFMIVAFAVFVLVKGANTLRRKEAANPPSTPPAPTREEILLTEIRDAIRGRNGGGVLESRSEK